MGTNVGKGMTFGDKKVKEQSQTRCWIDCESDEVMSTDKSRVRKEIRKPSSRAQEIHSTSTVGKVDND